MHSAAKRLTVAARQRGLPDLARAEDGHHRVTAEQALDGGQVCAPVQHEFHDTMKIRGLRATIHVTWRTLTVVGLPGGARCWRVP